MMTGGILRPIEKKMGRVSEAKIIGPMIFGAPCIINRTVEK